MPLPRAGFASRLRLESGTGLTTLVSWRISPTSGSPSISLTGDHQGAAELVLEATSELCARQASLFSISSRSHAVCSLRQAATALPEPRLRLPVGQRCRMMPD